MMPAASPVKTGWKGRFKFCPNRYNDVIGGDNAFGKGRKNATCIPCMYAEQMVRQGQTIEQVEAVPHLVAMFTEVLAKNGWTWQNMRDSYERMKRHATEAAGEE